MLDSIIKLSRKNILAICLAASLSLNSIPVQASDTVIKDLDKSSDFARQSITRLYENKVITGDSNGYFNPKQNVTRAQMIAIIVRALGLDVKKTPAAASFKDVPKNHWAFPYVEAALREGLITGVSKSMFGVNELCTREQMTAIFVRALGIKDINAGNDFGAQTINRLSDKNKIAGWSRDYVQFALYTGLIEGTSSNTFSPAEYANREQAAVVANRFIDNKASLIKLSSTSFGLAPTKIAALEEGVVVVETYGKDGKPMSQGSGFAVGKGLFLTNYHVVEGASKYTINDNKGVRYETQGIVKYNADYDLAIIKTKTETTIKPLSIGTKAAVQKADRIIAIGSPQGLQNTVSEGIVSGMRKFQYRDNGSVDIIQITAPVSHGSSGGALFDSNGNVIGVTSSMSDDSNLKFAVAIDHAKAWLEELKLKPFANIAVLDMSKQIAAYLDDSDKSIENVIYTTFRALEEENVEAYMSMMHSFSPGYRTMREELKKTFLTYDIDYDIQSVDILEKSYDSAKVDVTYRIKSADDPQNFYIYRIFGQYTLAKDNGQWKVSYAVESAETYEKDKIYGTGVGGFSDEFVKWAYNNSGGSIGGSDDAIGTALSFSVSYTIMHPTEPIIYISDTKAKKLYSYNYKTKQTKTAALTLPPESITFAGNEIYVALLKGEHSPYWYDNEQKGAIAILDSETLQIKEQLNIDIDPYDIVVKDGYFFVTSGSGQHSRIKSFSRSSLQEVSEASSGDKVNAELHPTVDRIYTTDGHSDEIVLYRIADGKFTDPTYPGGVSLQDYQYNSVGKFKFAPDGSYMITSGGSVIDTKNGGLAFNRKLGNAFLDVAFAPETNRVFTAVSGGIIYEYVNPGFKSTNTYKLQGEIVNLYYRDYQLIAVTKADNKYYIETVILKK